MKQNTSLNRLYCSYGPACFVALALLSAAPSARATTRTWSVGSGNWSTPSNWSPTGAPQNNDNLVFNNSPGSNLTNDISSLIVGTVLFNHSGTVWGSGFMVTTNITVSIGLIENGTVTLSSALTLGNTVVSFILGNGLNKHGDLIVNDQITGAGPNLRKGGPGKMSLMTDNAYTGVTLLQQGTIYVRSNKALSSAGVVISDGATLEVDGGFFPTLANAIEMVGAGAGGIGALYIIGGEVSLAVLTGSIQLDAATTVNVDLGSELDLNGAICGPGSLTKIGAGTLSLGGSANNYLGITTVSEGMLELESLNAISVPGDVVIGDNTVGTNRATLRTLDGQPLNPAANITVQSSGLFDVAGTNHLLTVGTLAGAGNVNLGSGSSLTVSNNADCVFGGVISGAGGFNKSGPALMQLAGTNHYTGITTILGGTLQAAGNAISVPGDVVIGENIVAGTNHATLLALDGQPLNPAANITVQSSGLFDVAGTNHLLTVGTLAGAGNVNLGSGSSLTVNGWFPCPSPFPLCPPFNGQISGSGTFIKSGPGTLLLTGNNALTGPTIVNAGVLQVDGSQPQSLVQVNGGRLQGSGTVGEIDFMASSAVVAPGDSPGILTCSNVAPVGSGNQSRGSLEIELNGTTPGTGYDQLNVHGTVTLNSRISLNASLNFPSSLNNTFTIINNTGSNAVAGTFSGLAQGATLAIGSQQFQISYTGGDGNDVVLTQISGAPLPTLSLAAVTPGAIALSWPTTGPAFTLQSSTNLSSSNWTAVSPGPVIVGANYVSTNGTTGAQMFFRLVSP